LTYRRRAVVRIAPKFGLPAPSDGAIGFFISAGSIPLFCDIGFSITLRLGGAYE
jgi:hypothetical protein